MLKRPGSALYKTSAKQARAKGKIRVKRFQAPLYRSIVKAPATVTKCCHIRIASHVDGYSFDIGLSRAQTFAIWFTQQDVFIWLNASNYSQVSVPGYSDLAALYDEVMIDRIDITMFTGNDPTTSANGTAQIILARDYNDKVAPAAVGDVQQYSDMQAFNMANNFINKFSLNPKFLTYSLDSAGTSTASVARRGYIRSNLSTDHYGVKGAFINNSPNQQTHTYQFKFMYKCRVCK